MDILEIPDAPFRFAVVNLGCKVNRVESDTIVASLMSLGGIAADQRDASIVVVNTCTVTGEADKKARKAVRSALRESGEALVYVTGCGAAVARDEFARIDDRVRVVRDSTVIFEGTVSSLRRFKDDVKTVKQGYECGIGVDGYQDIKVGDLIEGFRIEEIERTE